MSCSRCGIVWFEIFSSRWNDKDARNFAVETAPKPKFQTSTNEQREVKINCLAREETVIYVGGFEPRSGTYRYRGCSKEWCDLYVAVKSWRAWSPWQWPQNPERWRMWRGRRPLWASWRLSAGISGWPWSRCPTSAEGLRTRPILSFLEPSAGWNRRSFDLEDSK